MAETLRELVVALSLVAANDTVRIEQGSHSHRQHIPCRSIHFVSPGRADKKEKSP